MFPLINLHLLHRIIFIIHKMFKTCYGLFLSHTLQVINFNKCTSIFFFLNTYFSSELDSMSVIMDFKFQKL